MQGHAQRYGVIQAENASITAVAGEGSPGMGTDSAAKAGVMELMASSPMRAMAMHCFIVKAIKGMVN